MLSVVFLVFLFSVNLEFSYQKKIQTNLRTKVELFQKKYDFILTEVININKDVENIWEIVNDTRNILDTNDVKMINKAEHTSKRPVRNETLQCPRDFSDKLNRIEKYIQDEKQATRKRWSYTSSLIDRKQGEIMKIVNTISTDQVTQRTEQVKLRTDIDTLLVDHDNTSLNQVELSTDQDTLRSDGDTLRDEFIKLTERLTENVSKITNELIVTNKRLSNENIQINKKYNQLKDEFESGRKATYSATVSWLQTYDGWVQHGKSIYKGFSNDASWMDAIKTCKSESYGFGLLAEVGETNELNFVAGLTLTSEYFWLGGCDLDKEGSWKWCGSNSSMTFTNWNVNEPNNRGPSGKSENCLMCNSKASNAKNVGKWNDRMCVDKLPFVCEMPLII